MTSAACLGIDGCRAGWVAATTDGVQLGRRLSDLLARAGVRPGRDIVAIDMPIGLPASGRRDCDAQARRALDIRRNSVFWTATRAAVYADGDDLSLREAHRRASRINRAHGADGVSAQAFNLFDRIREVDDLLLRQPALQASLYEVHPELAFACWNGAAEGRLQPMRHAKKSGLGAHDRLQLVFARYGRDAFERARASHPASQVADDDIADAYGALYSAERIRDGMHQSLPATPPSDARGLPMRVCY